MNAFIGIWSVAASEQSWPFILLRGGLTLLLQTALLLAVGLWAMHLLQARRANLRALLGRSLLLAVLAGTLLSTGLTLKARERVPVLYKVVLPSPAAPIRPDNLEETLGLKPSPHRFVPPYRFVPPSENRNPKVKTAAEIGTVTESYRTETYQPRTPETIELEPASRAYLDWVNMRYWMHPFVYWAVAGISVLWAVGSVVLCGWLGVCHIVLWNLRRRAQPVQKVAIIQALAEVCATLNAPVPQLLQHPTVASPFLTGLLRPTIVLPDGKGDNTTLLEGDALRAVLLHEVSHLKRRDLWWNTLGRLGCALLWPQPLLWILCRRLEEINEELCDEAVLQAGTEKQQYAGCLLDWAERMIPRRAERVAGAGVFTGRSSIARRVQAILQFSTQSRPISKRVRRAVVGGTLAAILAMPLLVSINAASPTAPGSAVKSTPAPAKHVLQQVKDTPSYRVVIMGVEKGVLQGVVIAIKRQGEMRKFIFALTMRRDSTKSSRWILNDVTVYTFSDDRGLESTTHSAKQALDLPALSSYLIQQTQAAPKPVPPAELRQLRNGFKLPMRGIRIINAWAARQGRGAVTGRVIDENGQPVVAARVQIAISYKALREVLAKHGDKDAMSLAAYSFALSKTTRQLFYHSVETGQDGTYRATGLVTASYDVKVPSYGRLAATGYNVMPPARVALYNEQVTTRGGQTVTVPDIKLVPGGLLHVQVQDKRTHRPLPEVTIFGTSLETTRAKAPVYLVGTNDSGESLFRLPEGKARLSVGGQNAPGSHSTVAISKGVSYDFQHKAEIALDGGKFQPYRGATDVNIVKGKTREVVLRLEPYVAPTPTPTPLRLPPPPGKATLMGRVVDSSGHPVSGIAVEALMQKEARWTLMKGAGLDYSNSDTPNWRKKWDSINPVLSQRTVTRADGTFRLDGLTTAPYNLIIGMTGNFFGYKTSSGRVASAVEGMWAKEGQVRSRAKPIVMTHGAVIEGRVVDKATGQPLGGVIFGSNGPQIPASSDDVIGTKSDADGRFALRVAPGVTSLYIAGPNRRAMDSNVVYADNGAPANTYRIGTNRGLYAGSADRNGTGVQYEIDGGPAKFGLFFNSKTNRNIEIATREGQTRHLTIHLRRLITGKRKAE